MTNQSVNLESAVYPRLCSGILNGEQRAMEIDEVIFGFGVEYSREEAGKAQRVANPIAVVLILSLASTHLPARLSSTYQVTLEHLTASHQVLRKVCVFATLSTKAKNHRGLWAGSLLHRGISTASSIQLIKK